MSKNLTNKFIAIVLERALYTFFYSTQKRYGFNFFYGLILTLQSADMFHLSPSFFTMLLQYWRIIFS